RSAVPRSVQPEPVKRSVVRLARQTVSVRLTQCRSGKSSSELAAILASPSPVHRSPCSLSTSSREVGDLWLPSPLISLIPSRTARTAAVLSKRIPNMVESMRNWKLLHYGHPRDRVQSKGLDRHRISYS